MSIIEEKFYTLEETAEILSVSKQTLRNWDNNGYFKAGRTHGRHRRYLGENVKKMYEKMVKDEK